MIKVLTAIFLGGIISVSASASNWVDLGKSTDNQLQTFLDSDSIKPYKINSYSGGNYVSAFVQYTYINNNERRKKGQYYSKVLMVADCNKRAMGSAAYIDYGFKDEVVGSYQDKLFSASSLNIVFPETVAEGILEYMCY